MFNGRTSIKKQNKITASSRKNLYFLVYLQLVATLHGSTVAICDKIKQSAEGAIQAVIEFVTKRGNELTETDVSRFTKKLNCK